MNYRTLLRALILVLGTLLGSGPILSAAYVPPANNRIDLNFNYDWKFIKQDVANAQTVGFNDTAWQAVSLPHTWNNDKFREWVSTRNDHDGDPLNPSGTYYGKAWYRKHFTLDAAYTGRKVFLEFQGIGRVGTFYVNGTAAGLHENGVGPCGVDITNLVTFGADNIIAVQVNNDENYHTIKYNGAKLPYGQPFNPNFGGINRDVTLHICDKFYQTLPLYSNLGTVGTYIYPTGIDTFNKTAGLTVNAEVKNDSGASKTATLDAVVVDAAGNSVLTLTAAQQTVANGAKATFTATGPMTGIHFWSPDYPYLYTVYTILKVGGTVVDVYQTPLGVRKVIFNRLFGMQINGYPLYLNGYAPRCSMEWPCVGTPVDWMNELDFKMMKENNANFVRPMHIAPRKVQVEAADKYGIIMTVPAANNEGDTTGDEWQERLDIMRDVTIYFRNNPSVLFYEGCNQILTAAHMQQMKDVKTTWDPFGGRMAGLRSNDDSTTNDIREYSCTMDGAGNQLYNPLWDAEYARGEAPRRVWDNYTPMLNPRWDGVNASTTPGTASDTTHKYLVGGYFNISSVYHRDLGLNSGNGDFIGDYLKPTTMDPTDHAYFRLNNSEDMVLENLAKYYARYKRSAYVQTSDVNDQKGVMCGGAKIIWSDSVTDGRMRDQEITRVSGAVDGARLPKETYYALTVAHANPLTQPQVYVVGHWNYPAGTTKTVYVVSNTAKVKLQTFNAAGALVTDYGFGTNTFFPAAIFPAGSDQVNYYVYAFTNVVWQAGKVKAIGYDANNAQVATHEKATAGPAAALRITPVVGPSGQWRADGSDIAMFDVEVVDAAGNRCPTYEDTVTFSCSGNGVFLGGYNSGKRYSTNLTNLTSGYDLNVECGINRLFVRSTRTAGAFTLNAVKTGLTSASSSINSTAITVTNGLSTVWPQKYSVTLGTEPPPVHEGSAPPPPAQAPNPAPTAQVSDLHYSGGHPDQAVLVQGVQTSTQVYVDTAGTFGTLPSYLAGSDFIRPFQSDAGETSSTDQYQFNLVRYSFIYLAIDAANGMPASNNNDSYEWQLLPETITVRGRAMKLYKSRLMAPYENGYFAANGVGAMPFVSGSNMYLVFVQNVETPLQRPGMPASASSVQGSNTASLAIDGDTATRWNASSGVFPQSIKVDLGQQYAFGGFEINWQSADTRAYQYMVELSDDDVTYNLAQDLQANTRKGINEYRIPSASSYATLGRYVKITITGGSGWAAIMDMKFNGVPLDAPAFPGPFSLTGAISTPFSYQVAATNVPTSFTATGLPAGLGIDSASGLISGTPTAYGSFSVLVKAANAIGSASATFSLDVSPTPDTNMALNKPVTTSSNYNATNTGDKAVDSDTTTRWESARSDPQWIYVDLGGTKTIHKIVLNWNSSAGKDYTLDVSANASSWTPVVTVTGNATTGVITYPGLNVTGRYVRMYGTARKTGYGYSLHDFQVWGQEGGSSQSAPVITSVSPANGVVGTAFSYQIVATNNPTSYGLTPIPAGLTLNTSTGLITGTPTVAGTTNTTVSATNAAGTGTASLAFVISPAGGDTNIALNKPVDASSFQVGNEPANGNDGSLTTRWAASTGSFPQWWRVDLGSAKVLSRVDIAWLNSATRAYKYTIETSNDDLTYTQRVDKTGNTTFADTSDNVAVTARYVRVTVTGSTAGFASAFEFKVFGH
jgi:beta-galactosidase